jgi:hypothetical protein
VYDITPRHILILNGLYMEDVARNDPPSSPDEEDDTADLSGDIDALDLNTSRFLVGGRLRSLWGPGYTELIVGRSYAYNRWNYYSQHWTTETDYTLRKDVANQRTLIRDQFHLHWVGRGIGRDRFSAGFSFKPLTYQRNAFVRGDSILYNDDYLGHDPDSNPDIFYYDDQVEDIDETALQYDTWVQYTWRPTGSIDLTAGLRHDDFDYSEENALGGRASLSWRFLPRWSFNAAWGMYYQAHDPEIYMDEAGREWNRHLPHARADQYIAGLAFKARPSTFFSVEGYFKDYRDLLVSKEDVVREQTGDRRFQSDRWLPEKAKEAWGVEFFAQQKLFQRWYGSLSYSYGKAESTDPAYGTYPSAYDYRHVLTATAGYKTSLVANEGYRDFLNEPWGWWLWLLPINGDEVTFASRYRFMSGRPYTRQVWYEEGEASPEPIYEGHWEDYGHHNARYPAFSRWDVRIDSKHFTDVGAFIVFFEIQNLDDHPNVAEYLYQDDGEVDTVYQFRQLYVLGLRYQF